MTEVVIEDGTTGVGIVDGTTGVGIVDGTTGVVGIVDEVMEEDTKSVVKGGDSVCNEVEEVWKGVAEIEENIMDEEECPLNVGLMLRTEVRSH